MKIKGIAKKENLKKLMLYLIGIGVFFFFLFFLATSIQIGYSVKKHCKIAQEKYPGDCVEALIFFLNDENNDFRSRNSAIWALGQLGDNRALPVLEKYYTGNIPPRGSLGSAISQYELKKAINLASGGLNISAFVWR
jgi:hypothetical protein